MQDPAGAEKGPPALGVKRPRGLRLVATWFGLGLSPLAPGTMGSLGALPFAWVIVDLGGWQSLAAASLVAALAGLWVTNALLAMTENSGDDKDPSWIVIDEVAGQWIALLPAALDPVLFAVGFAAFRLFDVWKPWPVNWADRELPGAWGVMIDDLIAGGYAALCVYGAAQLMG